MLGYLGGEAELAGQLAGKRFDRQAQPVHASPSPGQEPVFLALAQNDPQLASRSGAQHSQVHPLTGVEAVDERLHLVGAVHLVPVDGQDDVAVLQTAAFSRTVGQHPDVDPPGKLHVQVQFAHPLLVDFIHGHPQVAAHYPAVVQDIAHRFLGQVDGHGQAIAHVVPRAGGDGRVDADYLAVQVEQGTARIARVDGRVGLDEALDPVVVADDLGLAAQGADDSVGQGGAHAQRVADGQDPVADLQFFDVAQTHGGQFGGVDLEQDDVDQRIGADHLGCEGAAVGQGDPDGVGAGDHVVVAENVAVGADHDPRAQAGRLPVLGQRRVKGGHPTGLFVLGRRRMKRRHPAPCRAPAARGGDQHYGRPNLLGCGVKSLAEPFQILPRSGRAALLRPGCIRPGEETQQEHSSHPGRRHSP